MSVIIRDCDTCQDFGLRQCAICERDRLRQHCADLEAGLSVDHYLHRAVVRDGGFWSFIQCAWPHVETADPVWPWHMRELASVLEEVARDREALCSVEAAMKRRREGEIALPPHLGGNDLVRLDGDSATVCAPLSYSLNRWLRMHWAKKHRWAKRVEDLLGLAVRCHWRGNEPWADQATYSIVRCSEADRPADNDNVVGGAKPIVDALVRAGLLADDSPEHLTLDTVEDRPRSRWGDLDGPGTWVILRRTA